VFNGANQNANVIITQVQTALAQIRAAMNAAANLNGWASGIALTDLTAASPDGPGMADADAQALLSACADAYGLSLLYTTGTDPRNVATGYNYGASQRLVLGSRPQ
jgi:hypothetical protein